MNDVEELSLDVEQIAANKEFFGVTRRLASRLQENPYPVPGFFIRDMTDEELDLLQEHSEVSSPHFEDLLMVALLLTVGEGIVLTEEQSHRSINSLLVMLACESLYRKGLVELKHENFSFGEDAGDNKVVILKNNIDYGGLL